MPDAKFLAPFVLMLVLVAPAVAAALSCDTCAPYSQGSWMDNLAVVQLFHSPNDYKWQGSWDPRYDADWQQKYCRDYDRAGGAVCQRCP